MQAEASCTIEGSSMYRAGLVLPLRSLKQPLWLALECAEALRAEDRQNKAEKLVKLSSEHRGIYPVPRHP